MPVEKLYDLTLVNQVAKGNNALLERLCLAFIDSANECMSELRQALGKNDYMRIYRAAHKLKSTIETMSVDTATPLIKLIEKNAKDEINIEQIPGMVAEAGVTIDKTIAQMKTDFNLL